MSTYASHGSEARRRVAAAKEATFKAVQEAKEEATASAMAMKDATLASANAMKDATVSAVKEVQQKAWVYMDHCREEWDAQPACFITDYALAIQSFSIVVYLACIAKTPSSLWEMVYFIGTGVTALIGGFIHHVAYKALPLSEKLKKVKCFGMDMSQLNIDSLLTWSWRVCIACTMMSHFSMLAFIVDKYFSGPVAFTSIAIAGAAYGIFAIFAAVYMHTVFMIAGFLPVFILGMIMLMYSQSRLALLSSMMLMFASGATQGMGISPSDKYFNHNSLAHVFLQAGSLMVLLI